MKSLIELNVYLDELTENITEGLKEAQQLTAKKIEIDAKSLARHRTGRYANSIKTSQTEIDDDGTIKTQIYSDLLVGGNTKWADVPLGALIEWGTGIKGASTNTYPHGYGYRMTEWCYYDEYLHQWVTTEGMTAKPHFYPALTRNNQEYINNIRKCLNERD